MNNNVLSSCKCYKRTKVYSARYKKGIQKQVSRLTHTDEEVEEILNTFKQYIQSDNAKYKREKEILHGEVFETKTPHLKTTEEASQSLERINIKRIVDGLDHDTGNNLCIFARSKSGKSTLLKQLVNEWIERDDTIIPIWMLGNQGADIYENLDSKRHVFFDGIVPSLIITLKEINSRLDKKYNFLIILDDIIEARHSSIVRSLAISFRNSRINSIYSLQTAVLVNPTSRSSSTVYIYGINNMGECVSILEKFLKSNPLFINLKNMNNRVALYQSLCRDYNFMVTFPLENDGEKIYLVKADDKKL